MTDKLPTRKNHRLEGYDYSTPGDYYITICVKDRRRLFGKVEPKFIPGTHNLYDCSLIHYPLAEIIEKQWKTIPEHFSNVEIGRYIIMPDHIHAILHIGENSVDKKGNKTTLPAIVSAFKSITTRMYKKQKNTNEPLWQPNYYDTVLDTGERYITTENYILDNPIRWAARETAEIKINY